MDLGEVIHIDVKHGGAAYCMQFSGKMIANKAIRDAIDQKLAEKMPGSHVVPGSCPKIDTLVHHMNSGGLNIGIYMA